MPLSEKAGAILGQMEMSGASETIGVHDILKTIAENGGDQEKDAFLVVCAIEIRNAAEYFIHQMMKGGE